MIIVDAPPWLKQIVNRFSLSYHQKKLLARYVTGLAVSNGKTVSAISSMYVRQGRVSLNRFLSEYSWDAGTINTQRLKTLQDYNQTRWNKRGVIIIDDTILEKRGSKIPYVGKFYDHASGRFVWGQCIVSMHYADQKSSYAIDYRHYIKKEDVESFKTKIDLARQMNEQYGSTVPADTFVWDSWYTCKELADCAEGTGKHWIGAAKSNLLVRAGRKRYVSLDEYAELLPAKKFRKISIGTRELRVYTGRLFIKSLQRTTRIVMSEQTRHDGTIERLYLITNRNDHTDKIISDYLARWSIENFYKDAKQYLGLGKIQARNIVGIRRHWYLVFLVHSLLRLGIAESFLGRTITRHSIAKNARTVCLQLLEDFVLWILNHGKADKEKVHDIMEVFLNR